MLCAVRNYFMTTTLFNFHVWSLCIGQRQYRGRWWPGNARSQGISRHVVCSKQHTGILNYHQKLDANWGKLCLNHMVPTIRENQGILNKTRQIWGIWWLRPAEWHKIFFGLHTFLRQKIGLQVACDKIVLTASILYNNHANFGLRGTPFIHEIYTWEI